VVIKPKPVSPGGERNVQGGQSEWEEVEKLPNCCPYQTIGHCKTITYRHAKKSTFVNPGIITLVGGHPNECVQVHWSDLSIVNANIK
jgi:hypothetical protein